MGLVLVPILSILNIMIILKHVSNDKGIRHQDDVVFHLFCRIPDGLCQMQSLSKFVGGTLDPDGVSQIHRFWPGSILRPAPC